MVFNLGHFGLGVIDSPEWKIEDREASYKARAIAARGALWGNHGYEATYPMTYADLDGEQLNGSHRHELTFKEQPPVEAFWSITMYAMPDYFLAENPIDRYSVGDRTPGLG